MNNDLPEIIVKACKHKGWSLDWDHRSAYLFLEVAELIEAVRGKGDPLKEGADVLFTLMAILEAHNIKWDHVVEETRRKTISLFKE
jgi:hypothetical protein